MINFKKIYQFKIMLNDVKPTIWRRIQVPETYTSQTTSRDLTNMFYPHKHKIRPIILNIPLPLGRNQHAYYQMA